MKPPSFWNSGELLPGNFKSFDFKIPRMAPFILAFLLPFLMGMASCDRHLMTPPTRTFQMESPKALNKTEHSLTFAMGGGNGDEGGTLGVDTTYAHYFNGSVLVKKGFGMGLEASLDLAYIGITNDSQTIADIDRSIWTLHAEGKYNPPGCEKFMALLGGVGIGTSAGGEFVGLDAGMTFGIENRYVVPYAGLKFLRSIPFNSKTLDLSNPQSPPGTNLDKAMPTYGSQAFTGLKFRFGNKWETLHPALGIEMSLFDLTDERPNPINHQFWEGAIGIEFPLGSLEKYYGAH